MRPFTRALFCAACLFSLAVPPAALADDDAPSSRQEAKGKETRSKGSYAKEMAALGEAATMLSGVKDEEGAKDVAEKLCRKFANLPPLLTGTDAELELLAKAQNKVNDQMERLMTTPYFVSSGLQDAWTMMTDQFSRRSAQKRRRR